VCKKYSTHFLGVRNAILAGGEIKEKTGPRRLIISHKYQICDGKWVMAHVAHVYVTPHVTHSTGAEEVQAQGVAGTAGVLYSLV
jgi:hypothetical protein